MASPASAHGLAREKPAAAAWTRLELVAFRIAFVYLTLDTVPRLIYALPGDWVRYPTMIDGALWRPIVQWVARDPDPEDGASISAGLTWPVSA